VSEPGISAPPFSPNWHLPRIVVHASFSTPSVFPLMFFLTLPRGLRVAGSPSHKPPEAPTSSRFVAEGTSLFSSRYCALLPPSFFLFTSSLPFTVRGSHHRFFGNRFLSGYSPSDTPPQFPLVFFCFVLLSRALLNPISPAVKWDQETRGLPLILPPPFPSLLFSYPPVSAARRVRLLANVSSVLPPSRLCPFS